MSNTDNPVEPENLIAAIIDAAEDIRDPLDGLVEKSADDPGAPFVPDALERLAALKKEDRAAFEALRGAVEESRLPANSARRSYRRGGRRRRSTRPEAGRHTDRAGAIG